MDLSCSLSFPKVGIRATADDPGLVPAVACVTASRVSCGNFLQKASPSGECGRLVADDYKK